MKSSLEKIFKREDVPDDVREAIREAIFDHNQVEENLRLHQTELAMQNEELNRLHEELVVSWQKYFDLYNFAPMGYITINEGGMIISANLTMARMLGVDRGDLVETNALSRFILEEDQDVFYRLRKQLVEKGECQACELRVVRKGGTHFWVRMEAAVVRYNDRADEYYVAISDIAKRKQAEEALHKLHDELENRVALRTAELKKEIIERQQIGLLFPFGELDGKSPIDGFPEDAHRTSGRILWVDDDELITSLGKAMVVKLGHHADVASSGEQALEMLEKNQYDLLITDLQMPGMDGWQLAENIKGKYDGMKVAIITGLADEFSEEKGRHGIVHILRKPFQRSDLESLIQNAIR